MKKYKIILTILAGIFIVNSCSESDLELVSPTQLSPDTFFSNEAQVQAAVNASYANLQTFALYGRLMFYMLDNMSHENAGNSAQEGDKVTYADFSFDSSNNQIKDYYDSCYRGVNKANFVINNADLINALSDEQLSPQRKAKYIAEARFLRAHYYWLLATRFGGVPIQSIDSPEGAPKASKQQVVDLIIADLTFASSNLLSKSVEDNGRANKGAAQAFLGKVLLYEEEYALALNAFDNMSGYGLENNYFDNFKEETEHGIESVFEVEYNINLGTGAKWDTPVGATGPNHATFRGQDYGVLNWFNVYPSDDLVAEFEPGDNRFQGSFYVPGDTYNNGANIFVEGDFAASDNVRTIAWKKYQNYYKQTSENEESGINVKVIRYADVLLMMAECQNNLGSQGQAITLINQVRSRAGLAGLPTNLGQQQVFEEIVSERKVELSGEQVRFDDMIRWGIVGSELSDTNFQSGKHELWPIPDAAISTNANMTSADQNPGY